MKTKKQTIWTNNGGILYILYCNILFITIKNIDIPAMGNQNGYKIPHPDWVQNIIPDDELSFSSVGANFNNCVEIFCEKKELEIYTTDVGAEAKSISGSIIVSIC